MQLVGAEDATEANAAPVGGLVATEVAEVEATLEEDVAFCTGASSRSSCKPKRQARARGRRTVKPSPLRISTKPNHSSGSGELPVCGSGGVVGIVVVVVAGIVVDGVVVVVVVDPWPVTGVVVVLGIVVVVLGN